MLTRACDLHIHSSASDGTQTPAQILALSIERQLGAIALTDHDTIAGAKELLAANIPSSIKFLTGVEISATPPPSFRCPGSFHILGYDIDLEDPSLNQTLNTLQDARKNRNPQIIARLNALGIDISLTAVQQEAADSQLGRPHIARVMIKNGFTRSIDEAFDKYLGKGKPAYVDKYRLSSSQAISLISAAGGIPVLAHPSLLETDSPQELERLLTTLKDMGLKGIEVYYPSHSPVQTAIYARLAIRHRLLQTGGTDFHGNLKPDIQIGTGRGNLLVPLELYEKLINRIV
jgi:predicted metal-dependent phosphoesterase TrpH